MMRVFTSLYAAAAAYRLVNYFKSKTSRNLSDIFEAAPDVPD